MTRLFNRRIAWLGAITAGLLFTGGCAGYGEGYYGDAALPATYYYGPDYYDPGYPYYYHFHDNDWWWHHDHDHWGDSEHWGDRGHWYGGGREAWAGRHGGGGEGGARIAGHREGPERGDGGHADGGRGGDGDGGFHGAATAGGHIGGTRR
jgi:hypothetical protein